MEEIKYITDLESVKSVYRASVSTVGKEKAPRPECQVKSCRRLTGYSRIPVNGGFRDKLIPAFTDCFCDGEHFYIAYTQCASCLGYFAGLDGFQQAKNMLVPDAMFKEYLYGYARGNQDRIERETREREDRIRSEEKKKIEENSVRLKIRQQLARESFGTVAMPYSD